VFRYWFGGKKPSKALVELALLQGKLSVAKNAFSASNLTPTTGLSFW